jgi:hypothetical protein
MSQGGRQSRPVNMPTCRATVEEREELKRIVKHYGLDGPGHFFRTCLERFFDAYHAGDLALPIDLVRNHKSGPKPAGRAAAKPANRRPVIRRRK